jgi:hypothetical protein
LEIPNGADKREQLLPNPEKMTGSRRYRSKPIVSDLEILAIVVLVFRLARDKGKNAGEILRFFESKRIKHPKLRRIQQLIRKAGANKRRVGRLNKISSEEVQKKILDGEVTISAADSASRAAQRETGIRVKQSTPEADKKKVQDAQTRILEELRKR